MEIIKDVINWWVELGMFWQWIIVIVTWIPAGNIGLWLVARSFKDFAYVTEEERTGRILGLVILGFGIVCALSAIIAKLSLSFVDMLNEDENTHS